MDLDESARTPTPGAGLPSFGRKHTRPPPPISVDEMQRCRDAEAAAVVEGVQKENNVSKHADVPFTFGGKKLTTIPKWMEDERPLSQAKIDMIALRFGIANVEGHQLQNRHMTLYTILNTPIPGSKIGPRYHHKFDVNEAINNGLAALLDELPEVRLYLAPRSVNSVLQNQTLRLITMPPEHEREVQKLLGIATRHRPICAVRP